MKTIQVRRTRHAGHCWRSKDELISDILLWSPSHGRAKVGRRARTDIQQLCADTGYSLEDLPGAMDDRDEWRERVREICVSCAMMMMMMMMIECCRVDHIYPTPPLGQDMTLGQFFLKRSLTGLNSEFFLLLD